MGSWMCALLLVGLSTQPLVSVQQDQLSGDYRVLRDGKPDPEVPLIRIRPDAAGAGWQMGSGTDSIALAPVAQDDMREMFGTAVDAGMQCGASSGHVVCRVDPGTALDPGDFVSSTGWFDVVPNVGPYELDRVGAAP